jgi:hypothetical protein
MELPPAGPSGEKWKLRDANPGRLSFAGISWALCEARNTRTRLSHLAASIDSYDLFSNVIVVDEAGSEENRFRVQFDLCRQARDQKRAEGCN